jgi:hypothetical protein
MQLTTRTLTLLAVATATATLTMAAPSEAANFSFRGNFSQDNNVQLFNFSVGSASNVTLKTLSYAGGTQADGTVVAAGGFDPILSLFDGAGNLINRNDDGNSSQVPADPTTGRFYDTFLSATLNPGSYTVAVSQFANFFNGAVGDNISQGFRFDAGPSNFRNGFVDVSGSQRTSFWAFDVLNVDQATVDPIPTPALLPGLVGLGVSVWRKRKIGEQSTKG